MGFTAIEKILSRTSGQTVRVGDIAICKPDMVMLTEQRFSVDGLWYRPKKLFDSERVALVFEHSVPAPTIKDAAGMMEGRRFAKKFNIKHFYDVGQHGICHIVAAEKALARPGELLVCSDSHTCASGALNCAARGTGGFDLIQALTDGTIWYPVSPTIRYEFHGSIGNHVNGKDIFFYIAHRYGSHSGISVEFGGPALRTMAMSDRRTIATMCAEISAEFAIFDYDEETERYLKGKLDRPATPSNPDSDAEYLEVRKVDLSEIEPHVIKPDFVQKNGVPISQLGEKLSIDQAFIGSCANGQIEDLRVAAAMLRGRKIAPGVRMIVTPGSQLVAIQAAQEGLIEPILQAGAIFTNPTCGACFGGHMGLLAAGEVCITASTRNFKGRMGSADAKIYMGSPATVAASAIAGYITDPRTISNLH